ncbi:MAG: tRNA (adenosine(37)-N6)-threonylcarbamoyltransferase complex dimerization subunit type 1 TsaB [Planctomycetota bacterium]|jgi:tRNA threonylcarbamoyladenosine biosynthesis protein TsaB
MKVIGIDTSGRTGSVGALGGDVAEERPFPGGTSHGRDLAPELHELLARVNWSFEDVELVAVSIGPGSYTGLRIGLSFAKAVSFAASIPLVGVPSFDAMVRRAPEGEALLAPVLDARWNQMYAAGFERSGDETIRRTEDLVGVPEEVIQSIEEGACFFGPGVAVFHEALEKRGSVAPPGPWDRVWAVEVASVGQSLFRSRGTDEPDHLHPIYLRPGVAPGKP